MARHDKETDQERGEMCLSADLSQCYPNRSPYVPMGAGDAARHLDAELGRSLRGRSQQAYYIR